MSHPTDDFQFVTFPLPRGKYDGGVTCYNVVTMNLLDDLNDEQKRAVTHTTGPLMIVAGAGTGKTTVLTRRIAWLIEQKLAKPEEILALTFTDKAAGEMEERVDVLLPYGYVDMQISTFHAFCERLLREYGADFGLARDFKLLSELDTWLLIRQYFDRFELDYYKPLGNPTKYLRGFLSHFSRLKDQAIDPETYSKFVEQQALVTNPDLSIEEAESEHKRQHELANAYRTYQAILNEHDSLDFGDLILMALTLLQNRPRVLKLVRDKFVFILVDEFQDTNHAQYELIKLLAAPRNNLTIVGDDDQSIYKFRGASLENILRFETDYPDTARVVLNKNYRSTQNILDHAHGFIQMNNPYRLEARAIGLSKRLVSSIEKEGMIKHIHAATLEDEVLEVIKKIVEIKGTDSELSWDDFAILVRSNSAGEDFAEAFERHGIPFQFLALSGLYVKPVILDTLALMRAIDIPQESPSFYRVLTLPMNGIDAQSITELNLLAIKKGKSLYDACAIASSETELSVEVQTKLRNILSNLQSIRLKLLSKPATECYLTTVKESGYLEYLNTQSEAEKIESFRLLQQFYERIKSFESRNEQKNLHAFLAEFAHERDAGEEGSLSVDFDSGPELVRIMTVHASKGLEFKHVFIANLVDRRFPAQSRSESIPLPEGLIDNSDLTFLESKDRDEHIEEERRLFYVAMTRAKEGLYFTSADDYGGARTRKLSRFLNELGYEKPDGKDRLLVTLFDEERGEHLEPKRDVFIPIPKQFSFTQLAAFKTCPYQYKFAHVLKVPVFGRWTFSFGKTMHNTLQSYFTLWLERKGKKEHLDGKLPVTEQELLDLYESCWQDDWYENDAQREEYREKGKNSLLDYLKSFESNLPSPLFLEQGFTLKFGDVVLKGRIDRMDQFEDGVEIIDYKTGTPKTDKTMKPEDREQLYLYQMAAIDVLGLKPKKLTYHYLEDNSSVSFLGSDDQLEKLRNEIIERAQAIRTSQFEATPGFHCRFCDFADICEFRQ